MLLDISVDLDYTAPQPCDALLQIDVQQDHEQSCTTGTLTFQEGEVLRSLDGDADAGRRHWVHVPSRLLCRYDARVELARPTVDLNRLGETLRHDLPSSVLPYLLPSRNCQSDLFLDFTASEFEGLNGGPLVQAMRDWVFANFTYDIFATYGGSTATDSFASQRGVCRDYAHVLIAFLRAAGLPARYVSAYAPDVKPQDFHAVVDVFLDGAWHLIDPTGMADAAQIARICMGRDATDTSFLTSYGPLNLNTQTVDVTRRTP